jgi:hypothetical protein
MMFKKSFAITAITVLCLFALSSSCKKDKAVTSTPAPPKQTPATDIAVPLGGNAYITQPGSGATEVINNNGLANWTVAGTVVSVYVRLGQTGQLNVGLKAKVAPSGTSSTVRVTVNGTPFTVNLSGSNSKTYFAGTVNINAVGYVKIDLQGLTKTGGYFADVSDIMIGGSATTTNVIFANDAANYYWSRRGPSCHLGYTTPAADKEYFYSELTVPAGEDKIGSYFMANGFGEGYFGIQVNSATERRVLFSVWDPAAGQGLTTLVRKGPDVVAGRFGGEGTGGQSYLVFNWQAGTTYKFLTKGSPDGAGNTIYTSWFFAPEVNNWKLLAVWARPNTTTYLKNFHGFLENFNPEQGYLGRKAHWTNQWVRLTDGTWKEVTEFKFTVDATGTNKQRMDFAGGVENGKFFLKNGGFFADYVAANTLFTKPATGSAPVIDFANLP